MLPVLWLWHHLKFTSAGVATSANIYTIYGTSTSKNIHIIYKICIETVHNIYIYIYKIYIDKVQT